MNGPTIRKATLNDLDRLEALEQASFTGDRLSRRQLRHHIGSHHAAVLVATENARDEIAGHIVIFFNRYKFSRIYSLAVDKAYRGQGIATALIKEACGIARKRRDNRVSLEVRLDNAAAIGLYEKLGFVKTADLPSYYEDGADGIRMALQTSEA